MTDILKIELHSFTSSYRIKKVARVAVVFIGAVVGLLIWAVLETDCPRCRLGYLYSYRTDDNLLDSYKSLNITIMASKNENKGSMAFADTILQYLEKRAENDELLQSSSQTPQNRWMTA